MPYPFILLHRIVRSTFFCYACLAIIATIIVQATKKQDGLEFFCYAQQYTNIALSNAVIQRNKNEAKHPLQTGQKHSSLCWCALVCWRYDTLLVGFVLRLYV
jgi:hypothetical protein